MADTRLAHTRELGLVSVRLASFRVYWDEEAREKEESDLARDFPYRLRKRAPSKETGRGE